MVVPARSRAGLMKFRAGIATYEKLGAVDAIDVHRNWIGADLAEHEPSLSRSRYYGACAYREYRTDDARLVLANLRAAARGGAVLVNHAPVVGLLREAGRVVGARVRCALGGHSLRVQGRAVVNAAGPWVEAICRLADPQAASRLHLSRGIHVTVAAERLPLRNPVVVPAPDGRSIFAIPHADCVYIGTTDVSHAGGPELWPDAPREEVEYLLAPLPRVFDVAPIAPEDCRAAWAGLRPLIAQPGKAAREISRRDEIWVSQEGLVSIAGGKLTGYRLMAEQVALRLADLLGEIPVPTAEAAAEPLPGGDFDGDLARLARDVERRTGLEAACAERLARLYGSEAADVVALGGQPLVLGGRVLAGEVDWAIDCEAAATLEDWIYRRSRVALYDAEECRMLLAPAAARMQERLGWSDARRDAELSDVRARLARDLGFAQAGSRTREDT
jgi:glycerol-3-phosphate dehydrogenase